MRQRINFIGFGLFACALLMAATMPAQAQAPAAGIQAVRQNFLTPPDSSRPMVRWWWFGLAVEKPEILKELQQMKANGIGGAELAFEYAEVLDDPAKGLKNLPFLSPEMLDDVKYAQTEGRKLGLRIDVTLCSGWPYGGPATTLAEASTRLRTVEVPVAANAASVKAPLLEEGEDFISASIVKLKPVGAESAAPVMQRGGRNFGPPPVTWDPATAEFIATPGEGTTSPIAIPPASVPRIALFFILSHTKQEVKRSAVGAEGWVLDSYSHQAVATHLAKVGEPLLSAFGNTPPYAIFSDSLEAFGSDWTPDLPAEFLKRRGYDLLPHLAELVGGGSPAAETVRHDYGRTLTDLVDENYLKQVADWAAAHNTKFRSQTYHESAVSFSSQNIPQLAEGEGPQWRAFSTLRWATSANHVFGHDVTSGETFTWLHSPVFRAVPLDMKVEADIDFVMGENQLIFHGWPYSPPDGKVPEPGWSLYAAAVFNNHNPWHPVISAVNEYIARLSYLMRQGQPSNQVVVLVPTDDAWASFRPTETSITNVMPRLVTPALMSAILSAGYNVDYIDADAVNKVGLGAHSIVVLPPTNRIPLETLKKLAAFTAAGGKVVAVGHAPTIDPEGKTTPEFTALTSKLFDAGKSTLVPDEAHLADALHAAAKPDFQLAASDDSVKTQIGFIRRKLTDADVYFLINASNRPMDISAGFATKFKSAEAWDPDTTVATAASTGPQSIHLEPYESRIFIFSNSLPAPKPAAKTETAQLADLSTDWKVNFVSTNKTVTEATLTDWTADPTTIHYSGEAVYSRDFTLAAAPNGPVFLEVDGGKAVPGAPNNPAPPDPRALGPNGLPNPLITRPEPRNFAYYDAPIREAALVTINGASAGALWHPPYRLDVSKLLKPGVNHIEIHVYNTALNAWSALPPHDYGPLIAKYGDKFQMQDLNKVMPISSGLLGTVHLMETK